MCLCCVVCNMPPRPNLRACITCPLWNDVVFVVVVVVVVVISVCCVCGPDYLEAYAGFGVYGGQVYERMIKYNIHTDMHVLFTE